MCYGLVLLTLAGAREGRSVATTVGHPVEVLRPELRRPVLVGRCPSVCRPRRVRTTSADYFLAKPSQQPAWDIVGFLPDGISEIYDFWGCSEANNRQNETYTGAKVHAKI
jgi:hypothetical protein